DTVVSVETLNTETLEERRFSNKQCRFGYRDSFFKTKEGKKYIITAVTFALRKDGKPNVSYQDVKKKIQDSRIMIQGLSPMKMRKMVIDIRKKKFPDLKKYGTAGSFFKNPIVTERKYKTLLRKWPEMPRFRVGGEKNKYKIPLAWILDKILEVHKVESYKVRKVKGGVGCFENQPIVIVNYGNASGSEVENFAEKIKKEVKKRTGIKISEEVVLFGK
ncbi:MAG: hypothetical protein Q8P52_02590, partial [bacterium]|nr:hypothetical protein [bacterium]